MSDGDTYMQTGNFLLIIVNGEPLALTLDELHEARERGRALLPPTAQASPSPEDRIVDSEGAAALTGVPASWFEEQMRQGRIQHLRFGKYRRLRLSDLLAAVETRRLGDRRSLDAKLKLAGK